MADSLIKRMIDNTRENLIIIQDGGMGDSICATVMIESAKRLNPDKCIVVRSFYPEIFLHNPNIDYLYGSQSIDEFFERWIKNEDKFNNILKRDIYNFPIYKLSNDPLSKIYCDLYGFPFQIDNPKIYLTYQEIEEAQKFIASFHKPVILIQPYAAKYIMNPQDQMTPNKDWIDEYWKELVKKLSKKYSIVQVGGKDEKEIQGIGHNLAGSTNIRQTAAIAKLCYTFISVDSVLQHIGCAVGKKGIVLFGRSNPKTFGHDCNMNIFIEKSCNDLFCGRPQAYFGDYCFQNGKVQPWECSDRKCMKKITPDIVYEKLKNGDF